MEISLDDKPFKKICLAMNLHYVLLLPRPTMLEYKTVINQTKNCLFLLKNNSPFLARNFPHYHGTYTYFRGKTKDVVETKDFSISGINNNEIPELDFFHVVSKFMNPKKINCFLYDDISYPGYFMVFKNEEQRFYYKLCA